MRLCADCYKVLVRGKPFNDYPQVALPCQSCGCPGLVVRNVPFHDTGLDIRGGAQPDA